MPSISVKVDLCSGHDACTPRPFNSFSPNVFVEGFEVARETDSLQSHGCSQHMPHSATVSRGYPTVTANGLSVAYVGASVTCPSATIGTGRPSVFLGEGARISFDK